MTAHHVFPHLTIFPPQISELEIIVCFHLYVNQLAFRFLELEIVGYS